TRSIAAWISAASGAYWGFRSSNGTCMWAADCDAVTAMTQLRSALAAVIVAEPVDEVLHPHLDRGGRPIAHVPYQVVDVGAGLGYVARLQRQQVLLSLAPQAFLDHLDVAQQLNGAVVADVVQAEGCAAERRVRRVAVPSGVGLRGAFERTHHPFRNVLHIGEVAPVMAVVEHVDRPTL